MQRGLHKRISAKGGTKHGEPLLFWGRRPTANPNQVSLGGLKVRDVRRLLPSAFQMRVLAALSSMQACCHRFSARYHTRAGCGWEMPICTSRPNRQGQLPLPAMNFGGTPRQDAAQGRTMRDEGISLLPAFALANTVCSPILINPMVRAFLSVPHGNVPVEGGQGTILQEGM